MSNPGAGDYYAVLGVPRRASEAELKKAYKRAAIRWHPDKNPDDRATAEENFKKIAEAFANVQTTGHDLQFRWCFEFGRDECRGE